VETPQKADQGLNAANAPDRERLLSEFDLSKDY